MAREHARILVRIWRDGDFKALSVDEQWLFKALLSQPTISNAGVLALQPRPWSRLAADMTLERVEAALSGLAAKRYLVVDEDTGEVLVRTFMRNDGVSSNGKVFLNALKVALQVQSEALRRVLAAELRKVGTDNARQAAAELDPDTDASAPTTVQSGITATVGNGDQKKSERPQKSCGVGEGEGEVVSSSSVVGSVGATSPKSTPDRRGARIPDDFAVTDAMRTWAAKNTPDVDLATQTANFVDHWASKPGRDARKLDWVRTWQRWMRTEQERTPSRPRTGRGAATAPKPTGDPAEWLRGRWQAGDAAAVARVLGERYERPDLPVTVEGKANIAEFFQTSARTWIQDHREAALAKLTGKAAA